MPNPRMLTQLRTKNLFSSYWIITKSDRNQSLFVNQFRANPLDFLSSLIDQLLLQFNDTYVRSLSEPEKQLYKICSDKWNALYNIVQDSVRIPIDGKNKAKTISRWFSPIRGVAVAVKNDDCFLARTSDTRCDTNNHFPGLVMCKHYFNGCGFVSRCHDKVAQHRCSEETTFHRYHIDHDRTSQYKRDFVKKLVKDAMKLKPFRNARLDIFPDMRRTHQIEAGQNIRAIARPNNPVVVEYLDIDDLEDEAAANIEELFPDLLRKFI